MIKQEKVDVDLLIRPHFLSDVDERPLALQDAKDLGAEAGGEVGSSPAFGLRVEPPLPLPSSSFQLFIKDGIVKEEIDASQRPPDCPGAASPIKVRLWPWLGVYVGLWVPRGWRVGGSGKGVGGV